MNWLEPADGVMFRVQPVSLHDSRRHGIGSGAELFIVEGDSASKSVCRVRNAELQAVLPMQGKPLNPLKVAKPVVARFELYRKLIAALGTDWDVDLVPERLRYDRVLLLFDPDADGIHACALTQMFFYRWMRPLLDGGRIMVVRSPLVEVVSKSSSERVQVYSESQLRQIREQLDRHRVDYRVHRYRGLASLDEDVLTETCLEPTSRGMEVVTAADVEAAIRVFAPLDPAKRRPATGRERRPSEEL